MNMLNEFGFRQDARKPKQIRNIVYQLGIYSQADGSAYLEQGGTKVGHYFVIFPCSYLHFFFPCPYLHAFQSCPSRFFVPFMGLKNADSGLE